MLLLFMTDLNSTSNTNDKSQIQNPTTLRNVCILVTRMWNGTQNIKYASKYENKFMRQ